MTRSSGVVVTTIWLLVGIFGCCPWNGMTVAAWTTTTTTVSSPSLLMRSTRNRRLGRHYSSHSTTNTIIITTTAHTSNPVRRRPLLLLSSSSRLHAKSKEDDPPAEINGSDHSDQANKAEKDNKISEPTSAATTDGQEDYSSTTTTKIHSDSNSMDDEDEAASSSLSFRNFYKEKIQALAFRTLCGFQATPTDRQRMQYLIQQCAKYNPTAEPAADFFDSTTTARQSRPKPSPTSTPSLCGKWTLLYTDAPDILSLSDNDAVAQCQRIGQECQQASSSSGEAKEDNTITNVIEWIPPVWVGALPPSLGVGTPSPRNNSKQGATSPPPPRILQKVVTQASASPSEPSKVNLKLKGIQVVVADGIDNQQKDKDKDDDGVMSSSSFVDFWNKIQTQGFLPALLREQPLQLQGPLVAPFGSFEILYLDEELRMVRTSQGYYAVNKRNTADNAWF